MDECSGMDELEDDGEVKVTGVDIASGTAGEEGEGRAKTLSAALAGVGDVGLHGRVEGASLLGDPLLDAVELGVDEFEGLLDVPGRTGFVVAEIPDEFHREKVSVGFPESQWLQALRQKTGDAGILAMRKATGARRKKAQPGCGCAFLI
jgi:hypothetical protein